MVYEGRERVYEEGEGEGEVDRVHGRVCGVVASRCHPHLDLHTLLADEMSDHVQKHGCEPV